jgi:hypothetical protein
MTFSQGSKPVCCSFGDWFERPAAARCAHFPQARRAKWSENRSKLFMLGLNGGVANSLPEQYNCVAMQHRRAMPRLSATAVGASLCNLRAP